jgi:hypothetical protein
MIPPFEASGNLPVGVHTATWSEFVQTFGTNRRRHLLLTGLRAALESLRVAGCRRVYIDGSFVTAKRFPNDFDGCWNAEDADPDQLDPVLLEFARGRAAQKAKYHGELFPAHWPGALGLTYLEFFQLDRDGRPKGIIALDLQEFV